MEAMKKDGGEQGENAYSVKIWGKNRGVLRQGGGGIWLGSAEKPRTTKYVQIQKTAEMAPPCLWNGKNRETAGGGA